MTDDITFEPVARLDRALRPLARDLSRDSARSLVDLYYQHQQHRITLNNQLRAQIEAGQSTDVLQFFADHMATLEKRVVSVLKEWVQAGDVGQWALDQKGIGPVLAAGLSAHIDITKAPTVGHIWRFAGLDPTVKWRKGQKRPWNADLKVLCWKIGDSFVKVSGRDDAFYGQVYRARKDQEVTKNDAGDFADQAAASLRDRNITDTALRATYEAGRLPAGRLDLRARRYAVKLFLAHWHEVAYMAEFGEKPPKPYAIEHLGHAHKIDPPGLP